MKDKYKYLVAFTYKTGDGSTVITYNKKIRSERDIILITKFIEADNKLDRVAITNFILLDTKWGVWDWFVAMLELVLLSFCTLSIIASLFA